MTISLTINAQDPVDLRKQLAALLGDQPVAATPAALEPVAPKAETPAPKVTPKPAEPEAAAEAEVETPAAEQPAGDDAQEELTYEGHIKPAVLKVSTKLGRPGVEKLLAQFEAGNAKDVPQERWVEFLAEIDKLLA